MNQPIWQPSPERIAQSNMTAFMRAVMETWRVQIDDYAGLYAWSVAEPEKFWRSLWSFAGIVAERQGDVALQNKTAMPGARWFPEARLNFAQNLLRRRDDETAIVFWGEDKVARKLGFNQLFDKVSQVAQALRAVGVGRGDRVAGYLPNMPEAVIAMLAAATIGATWSSCSPDFGAAGVLDRFGQIAPKVLFAVDGYWYNGKQIEVLSRVAEIAAQLPSLATVVIVPYLRDGAPIGGINKAITLDDFIAAYEPTEIQFEALPFDYPLYILYSSGTTGVPKCIVHGAGGTLLQHVKEHLLHVDVKAGDRLFYFTTCGWMMWNWLVSGLACGATLMLYDGSPFHPRPDILFDYVDAERITIFGTSAKYLDALHKHGVRPMATHRLASLQTLLSTGSPLAPESYDYVYSAIKNDVQLSSISGGTDIVSCFAQGNPLLPVWRGELQSRGLGMRVEVFDDDGRPVRGQKGELVCTAPFPSMPIGFWDDDDGRKYRAAYFSRFPDVWWHGDYAEITEHDGLIIHGRSDAVLNPGGVRIGTAEIYRQVEQLDEVVESLVIGQDWPPGKASDVRVVLFVRLRDGLTLDDALVERIKQRIRSQTTPRHVPARIIQIADIPRTKSGKIVELAVRNVVHRLPVKNRDALANPEALDLYVDIPALQA
ncbi:MAG: acetoacetate--CoA ligase [Burkholderiales bacterium]|nr:acetoacetate--CoA ligase [Burkholderiales bacterium]